jgi:hypothetical protein
MFAWGKTKQQQSEIIPSILVARTDQDQQFLPALTMKCLNQTLQVLDYEKTWQLLGWFFEALNTLIRQPNLGGSCRVKQKLASLTHNLSTGILPLLPVYDVVFTTNVQQVHSGLLVFPKVVSKGANGSIRLGTYKGVSIVIKVPHSMTNNDTQLVEALLHTLLMCQPHQTAYSHMLQRHDVVHVSINEYPILDIYFVAKSKSNLIFVGLQQLHTTLTDEIQFMTKGDLMDIMLQITTKLYFLQMLFGFMHRDFHADNVMLRKRKKPLDASYEFEDVRRILTSKYRVYFIDFGMSCVDFSRCRACDWIAALTPGSPYDLLVCEQVPCQNFSFDLRYLMGFLHTNQRSEISRLVVPGGAFDKLLYQSVENIDISVYPEHTQKLLDRHKRIAAAIDVHDDSYTPLAVMRVLLRERMK